MNEEQKYKFLFSVVYSLIGGYLTTLSYIIYKSDSVLENPYIIFLIGFFIFFFISLIFSTYVNRIKNSIKNYNYAAIKITSFLGIVVLILLLLYTINSLNKIHKNYSITSEFDIIQDKEHKLENLNKVVVGISLVITFFIFLFVDFKNTNLNKNLTTNEYIKLVFLLLFLLGSLIPLSILLDYLIRIIGFAIGISGGL